MESGQLARFPAATRLGAAPTYPFDVLHVLCFKSSIEKTAQPEHIAVSLLATPLVAVNMGRR